MRVVYEAILATHNATKETCSVYSTWHVDFNASHWVMRNADDSMRRLSNRSATAGFWMKIPLESHTFTDGRRETVRYAKDKAHLPAPRFELVTA